MQQPQPPLQEVGVEVGLVRDDGVTPLQVGLHRLQQLHPHVGQIAQLDVEAAFDVHDLVDRGVLGESVREIGVVRVLNQTVAHADVA